MFKRLQSFHGITGLDAHHPPGCSDRPDPDAGRLIGRGVEMHTEVLEVETSMACTTIETVPQNAKPSCARRRTHDHQRRQSNESLNLSVPRSMTSSRPPPNW